MARPEPAGACCDGRSGGPTTDQPGHGHGADPQSGGPFVASISVGVAEAGRTAFLGADSQALFRARVRRPGGTRSRFPGCGRHDPDTPAAQHQAAQGVRRSVFARARFLCQALWMSRRTASGTEGEVQWAGVGPAWFLQILLAAVRLPRCVPIALHQTNHSDIEVAPQFRSS